MYNIIKKGSFVKAYKPFINSILFAFFSCLDLPEALTYGDLARQQQEAVILIRKGGALGGGSASERSQDLQDLRGTDICCPAASRTKD